jgi:hypothetical protein
MKKNGLLQTFFLQFFENSSDKLRIFEEMKKGTSAIHGATFFFIKRGMALRKMGMAPRHSIFL